MNSQVYMMVLAVEGCRGPPVRKKKVIYFGLTAIIKIKTGSNYKGEQKMKTTLKSKFWMMFTPPPQHTATDRAPPTEEFNILKTPLPHLCLLPFAF